MSGQTCTAEISAGAEIPACLSGEHPQTPWNILVADGSAPTALMGRTALLPLLLFLFHWLHSLDSQNLLHVGLVDGQLAPAFPDLVKLGIERFLLPQKLGEFRLQALDRWAASEGWPR